MGLGKLFLYIDGYRLLADAFEVTMDALMNYDNSDGANLGLEELTKEKCIKCIFGMKVGDNGQGACCYQRNGIDGYAEEVR